jgi:hypothetical protein
VLQKFVLNTAAARSDASSFQMSGDLERGGLLAAAGLDFDVDVDQRDGRWSYAGDAGGMA